MKIGIGKLLLLASTATAVYFWKKKKEEETKQAAMAAAVVLADTENRPEETAQGEVPVNLVGDPINR